MLKVLIFYLVLWWFAKLTNKKLIIVRAILASSLSVFFLIGAITMFIATHIPFSVVFGFGFLIATMLFGLRAIIDIKNILIIKRKENE